MVATTPLTTPPTVPRRPPVVETDGDGDRAEIGVRETEETNIDEFVTIDESDMDRQRVDIVISDSDADAAAGVGTDQRLASPLAVVPTRRITASHFAIASPSGPSNTLLTSTVT